MAFRNIVFSAIVIGILSGLFYGLFQQTMISPIIYGAEQFELSGEDAAGHSHAADAAKPSEHDNATPQEDVEAWGPEDGLERISYSLGADVLVAIAFAMIMLSLMVWHNHGTNKPRITVLKGAVWGGAAMISLFVAPALFGLHPEVPGTIAAELINRQAWWGLCVLATAGGLAVLYYSSVKYKFAGVLLVLLPHLLGAPLPESLGFANTDPEAVKSLTEYSADFVLMTSIGMAGFYGLLGLLSAFAVSRFISGEQGDTA